MASKHKLHCLAYFSSLLLILFVNIISCFSQITPAPLHCQVPEFDYFNLTAAVWSIKLDQQTCLTLNSTDGLPVNQTSCLMYVGFCQNLNWLGVKQCQHSSVCQRSAAANFSLGAYSYNPFIIDDAPVLQAKFDNGDPYIPAGESQCQLKTTISLVCSHNVLWPVKGTVRAIQEAPLPKSITFNSSTCEINLVFDYAGACRRYPSSQGNKVGAGTIVIIVFTTSFLLYLFVGSLFNVSQGYSGIEVVPHHSFWLMLPGLIKEGFMFTFCRSRSGRDSSNYEAIR